MDIGSLIKIKNYNNNITIDEVANYTETLLNKLNTMLLFKILKNIPNSDYADANDNDYNNMNVMSELKTPIIIVVTGEGGSGGALAISVGDHISMLQYATYSVASPEACASIIWRTADKAPDAAEAMKVSSKELKKLNIIDEIITEPLGGAHRDYDKISLSIKESLIKNLSILNRMSKKELLDRRYKRLVEIGI